MYDETSISSSESMTDLKREVARFRDTESHSGKYIADLEARLTRSDESVLILQQTVEKLETECDRRRDEAELLQSRLDILRQDGESWRTDLETRERKVRELEQKMEEWERKRKDAGEERLRLGSVVGEVAQARKSLEVLGFNGSTSSSVSGASTPNTADHSLESQLVALRQIHTATLADLSSVTAKYRDALREISDLAAQIQEAKFNTVPVAESPAVDLQMDISEIPPFRRRVNPRTREITEPQVNSPSRRLFFRQAISAESLHSR
jgi:kinesin family protein 4/21/27